MPEEERISKLESQVSAIETALFALVAMHGRDKAKSFVDLMNAFESFASNNHEAEYYNKLSRRVSEAIRSSIATEKENQSVPT